MFRYCWIGTIGWIALNSTLDAQPPRKKSLDDLQQQLQALREKKPQDKPPAAPRFPFNADAARAYQKAYADWLGLPLEWTNDLGMTFVLIPPGTFLMGSPADEPGHNL